ncbi:MAG: M13 family metallopeptidase [Deltaproteobacteria bacterium]|nr:M13 family metallopeptidase [Deltaproteobacteria bacterium]
MFLSAFRMVVLGTLIAVIPACVTPAPAPKPTTPSPKGSATTSATSSLGQAAKVIKKTLAQVGLDPTALDRKVDPCDDFYRFACGGWIAKTTIPADKSRWVRSFSEIHKRNEADLQSILEAAAKAKDSKDKVIQKLGTFYRACMDQASIDHAKLAPLAKLLRQVRQIKSAQDLQRAIATFHAQGVWVFFSITGAQDYADATRYIAHLDQAGLGLPDRDYYLKTDAKSKKLRAAYLDHVAKFMRLAGYSKRRAVAASAQVMRIETALAKASKTRVERRDPRSLYHKIDRVGLKKVAPRFAWDRYLAAVGLVKVNDINVAVPKFFAGFNAMVSHGSPRDFSAYLTWHVLRAYAPALSKPFVDEAFAFRKRLTGQKVQRPRWKRCVAATDDSLGEILAQPYVAKRFGGDRKAAVTKMVRAIREAFGKIVSGLPWMDPKTRKLAEEKLSKMTFLIGYPDIWKRYPFALGPHHVANLQAAEKHEVARLLGRIGKAVDPKEWQMTPPTVNAYYEPLRNHMVFPAGILQPPFYNHDAALAVNMGAMGMVVGHEMTHGFDDQGSRFDAYGNLKNWWTPAVRARFEKNTGCMVKQFSAYEPLPGVKLKGKLTLGENIADAGGVKLAYRAFRALTAGKARVEAGGFSDDQLFFLSVGQTWCAKSRESLKRLRAQTDPHSPPRFRVDGSLSNTPEFAAAFHCKAGTKMAPKERCLVW